MAIDHSDKPAGRDAVEVPQDAVIAFLADPRSHDPVPDSVKRIDTHAAVVFLAGDVAYKIKRAVKLPYLDFSTLEMRHDVCMREVEINRRTAPDIYLGVVPVTRSSNGKLAIDGPGKPVEWAVKMRRFDETGLFDRLAGKGELSLDLMKLLAREIAALHAGERAVRTHDGAMIMKHVVEPVLAAIGRRSSLLVDEDVGAYAKAARRELTAQSHVLRERARQGYVRHCHGDLHLQNIVRIDGRPVLFDAIEFDDSFATVDTFYDLAFLLMDLWHRELPAHANTVFNAYMRESSADRPIIAMRGLALLPLFLSVRAGVRAMVALDRLAFVHGPRREAAVRDAASYFRLANTFLDPAPPRLIAVGGLSGTGKSTLAAALAPALGTAPGALVIRSDVERKRLAGTAETDRLGKEHYSAAATGRVYGSLCRKAEAALAAGQTVVLDAVFARPYQRLRVEQLANRAGVPFAGFWLEAPERELIERVEARTGDASDANAKVVQEQLGYETGVISWQRVDARGAPGAVQRHALKVLREMHRCYQRKRS